MPDCGVTGVRHDAVFRLQKFWQRIAARQPLLARSAIADGSADWREPVAALLIEHCCFFPRISSFPRACSPDNFRSGLCIMADAHGLGSRVRHPLTVRLKTRRFEPPDSPLALPAGPRLHLFFC